MKHYLLLICLVWGSIFTANAQLPNGTIAPDWTADDIYGTPYNLYSYLNNGKVVFINFFATGSLPSWTFHDENVMNSLYYNYGPNGTINDDIMVFEIEVDSSTNKDCLYGLPTCSGSTQGNYAAATICPLINDDKIGLFYQVASYPTTYMICPETKKCYNVGQTLNTAIYLQQMAVYCAPVPPTVFANSTDVKCFGTNTGNITLNVSGGVPPYTYLWNTGAVTKNLLNIPAGTYSCTITGTNGATATVTNVYVDGPPAPLVTEISDYAIPGCNGNLGYITVSASGGWDDYTYLWNYQSLTDPSIYNLNAGTYTCTITDAGGCTQTESITFAVPTPPLAVIVMPPHLTCTHPQIVLDASGSSQGDDLFFSWTTSGTGHIVSGEFTPTPVVDAPGFYTLTITNDVNNCNVIKSVLVVSDISYPAAQAGPPQLLTCSQNTVALQGSGSSGSNFTYLWTASNGGNIVSGAGTLTPIVNAAGTYTLKVTNTSNGCTSESVTTVTANNTPPTVSASGGLLTCAAPTLLLGTTSNAVNPTFSWSGPGGFTANTANPTVQVPGIYQVTLTNGANGCTATATATVTINKTIPSISTTGGIISCYSPMAMINGSSAATNATFTWTGPGGFSSITALNSVGTPGAYTLVVTDPANGCSATSVANVVQNTTPPIATIATPGVLNCNNLSIQINGANSSQGPLFSYSWSTIGGNIVSGNNTSVPLVNLPGQYTIVVTNIENGCTATAQTNVIQRSPVSAAIVNNTDVSCFGGQNGTATALGSGGSGTYTYSWSSGGSNVSASGLAPGLYQVIVTDSENCSNTASIQINEPTPIQPNATTTNQSAVGVNDGTATAIPTGGTGAYAYLWSTTEVTASISGLAPGAYVVIVTDANGCTAQQTVNVNEALCNLSTSIAGTNVTCHGANNGTATVNIVGATDPVVYSWSSGQNMATVSGLAPGFYTVEILDGNNCPATLSISITEPTALATNVTTTAETGVNLNDGSATANPTGGIAPYSYAWSNGDLTATISNLAPGIYTVSITDGNGCQVTQTVEVAEFDCNFTNITTISDDANCFGSSDGSATIVIDGGAPPFTYLWSDGQTEATATDLSAGTYVVVATDSNGCSVTESFTINEPEILLASPVEIIPVQCPGDTNGSITVTGTGGTGQYLYLWSNGQTTATATGLSAGVHTVEVTDNNGCAIALAITLDAIDNIPPTVAAQNGQIAIDANGTALVTATALQAIAADNCAETTLSFAPASFACSETGQHQVVVTATDGSGNTATTAVTVTVVDLTAPTLTCPPSVTRCAEDNIVSYNAPVATDNCLGLGGQWDLVTGLPSGSEFPQGVTTQTYSYTDASGNTGTCAFDVVITPPILVALVSITDASGNLNNGNIQINISGGSAPYTIVWTNAAGVIVGTQEDLVDIPSGTYHVEVTDATGCTALSENYVVLNLVGASEPWWSKKLSLHPNPTQGAVQLDLPEIMPEIAIIIHDMNGKLVQSNQYRNLSSIPMDVYQLADGMYTLRIVINNEIVVKKLAVQR